MSSILQENYRKYDEIQSIGKTSPVTQVYENIIEEMEAYIANPHVNIYEPDQATAPPQRVETSMQIGGDSSVFEQVAKVFVKMALHAAPDFIQDKAMEVSTQVHTKEAPHKIPVYAEHHAPHVYINAPFKSGHFFKGGNHMLQNILQNQRAQFMLVVKGIKDRQEYKPLLNSLVRAVAANAANAKTNLANKKHAFHMSLRLRYTTRFMFQSQDGRYWPIRHGFVMCVNKNVKNMRGHYDENKCENDEYKGFVTYYNENFARGRSYNLSQPLDIFRFPYCHGDALFDMLMEAAFHQPPPHGLMNEFLGTLKSAMLKFQGLLRTTPPPKTSPYAVLPPGLPSSPNSIMNSTNSASSLGDIQLVSADPAEIQLVVEGGRPKRRLLKDYTVKELREKAKARKIKGYSALKKSDLIALLQSKKRTI